MADSPKQPLTFSQQFQAEKDLLLKESLTNTQMTKLRNQLTNKVEVFKRLQAFKEELLRKMRDLRARGSQLETQAKTLSENKKKQYPVFIKFITKQIKTVVLDLGKKFNKLNEYQKMELISYLAKHYQNNDLVKSCLKLSKQKYRAQVESEKRIYDQRTKTLEKKMEVEELEKYNKKLIGQKEYLVEVKRPDKLAYDTVKEQIAEAERDTTVKFEQLQALKKRYLEDFNVAVCRERIHVQYTNQLKQAKLGSILNKSINDVEKASKERHALRGYLRNQSVANILGNVASYKVRNQRVASMSVQKIKTAHKRNMSKKTQHTESTAMRTKPSMLFAND